MPFNPQAHRAALLQHYITMAQQPGWREYTWHRIKQMARDNPELYADFPTRITDALSTKPEQKK